MSRKAASILLPLTLLAALPARAGVPMITDDPDTPAAGLFEENISLTLTRTHAQTVWQTPIFDNSYGLTDHVQLIFAVPLEIVEDRGHGPVAGVGVASASVKYRFLDTDDNPWKLSLSIAPAFTVNSATHGLRHAVPTDGANFFLPLQFNKKINDDLDLFGEVGYVAVQYHGDQWSNGLCLCWHAVHEKLDLLAEVHVVSDTSFHFNDVVLNFGLVYAINDHTNLLFSAGRACRDTDQSEQLLLYAGFQFHFR